MSGDTSGGMSGGTSGDTSGGTNGGTNGGTSGKMSDGMSDGDSLTRSNPPATHGSAPVRERILRWRSALQAVVLSRGVLVGIGAGGAAVGLSRMAGVAQVAEWSLGGVVAASAAAFVWRRARAHALTVERTALWLEERAPSLRYALVSAIEGRTTAAMELAHAMSAAMWEAPARAALWRSLRIPAVVAAVGLLIGVMLPRSVAEAARAGAAGPTAVTAMLSSARLGSLTVSVEPPAYARLAARGNFVAPTLVRALPGSRVDVTGAVSAIATSARLDDQPLGLRPDGNRWRVSFVAGSKRALLTVARASESRLVALEPVIDSAPVVTLHAPARDSVLRAPRGSIALVATVRDDLGIASAAFEYIVSSGEGERFSFTRGTLGAQRSDHARATTLRASLDIDALALSPGDVVHLRAVARDWNNITGPGVGTSESRAIRIARAGEYDSVAVDQAPPPEADKSILSQRMLINLTEALVKRARSGSRDDMLQESRRIARDQTRLRRQVSDIIFSRLGDGAQNSGEHSHDDGHGHANDDALVGGALTPEQLLRAAERATEISGNPLDFEHDESPVVAINRPMLEAYNAMWDAGRSLDGGEPQRALPAMYRALAAIQRARNAERVYLRGTPPRVVIDLQRVRLKGKELGAPVPRSPRLPLDASRAGVLARFGNVITALARNPRAGIDSLIVLRLAVVERHPAAASALESAADEVRTGRDATASLLRARRALDGGVVVRNALPVWGGVP